MTTSRSEIRDDLKSYVTCIETAAAAIDCEMCDGTFKVEGFRGDPLATTAAQAAKADGWIVLYDEQINDSLGPICPTCQRDDQIKAAINRANSLHHGCKRK